MILLVVLHRNPGPGPGFGAFIKEHADSFWKATPDAWFVDTKRSVKFWSDALKALVRPTDSVLVIRVQPDYGGWLDADVWEWLKVSVSNKDFE